MIALAKIIRQRDTYRARAELMRMLAELSDDALKYVWRPIAYAWCYTDENDPDGLTRDDLDRITLLGSIAYDNPYVVSRTCVWHKAVLANERKRKGAAAQ